MLYILGHPGRQVFQCVCVCVLTTTSWLTVRLYTCLTGLWLIIVCPWAWGQASTVYLSMGRRLRWNSAEIVNEECY